MLELFKQFDEYSLRARLFPALIAGLPTFAFLLLMVHWNQLGISELILSAMVLVLLFAIADVARQRGLAVEEKLGTRSTPELWHRDNAVVEKASKDWYRTFMAAKLGVAAPTAAQERNEPEKANGFYRSAANWLRENTRDTKTFRVLFDQLVTYGFRRNLLGLKPVALAFNGLVLVLCGAVAFFPIPYTASIEGLHDKMLILAAAVVLHSAYIIFVVNKRTVRQASEAYGKQLMLTCETLSK